MRTGLSWTSWLGLALLLGALGATGAQAQSPALSDGIQRFEQGDFAGAIPPLQRAIAADSSRAAAYPLLATALLRTGQTASALDVAQSGARRFPDHATLALLTAEAYLQLDTPASALPWLQRVDERVRRAGPDVLPARTTPEQLRQQIAQVQRVLGGRHAERRAWDRATSHFQSARRYAPDSVATHRNLAYAYVQQEQWGKALDAANTGLARFPNDEGLLRLKASVLYEQQILDELAAVLERLYRLRPDDPSLGVSYGQALLANRKAQESQAVFDSLLQRFPRERPIYEALIDLNRRRLNYPGVLEVLRRMETAFPDDDAIPRRRARVHALLEDYAAARAIYDSLRTRSPADASLGLAIGSTYEQQDSLQAAAAAYRHVVDQQPDHPAALRALGRVLEAQERWPDAQRVYEQLAAVHSDPHAHVRMGWVHEQRGQPADAAAAYRQALDADTDDPLAAYRYSALLLEQGDGTEARAFALAERALRQSLRGVKDAQELMMASPSSDRPSGAAPDSAQQRAAARLDRLDDIATDAFRHFTTAFPRSRTEPVLQDLLRRYARSGRLPFLMGRYYEQHADTALALQHYRDAAAANPDFRDAHLALGRLYETQGNVVEAIRSFERALALDATDPAGYDALIRLYRQRGQLDALIARWKARYRATTSNAVLRDHLIEALHKAGRYEDAQPLIDAAAADTASGTP